MLSSLDEPAVLVTGASGQVGTAFRSVIPAARFLKRSELDLSRPESVYDEVIRYEPTAVLNCAAYTNVDRAEDEEELATRVNGVAVGEMARACADLGAPFVTFSTDYVFDGTAHGGYVESDSVAPINAYGRSKLVGERLVLEENSRSLVVRTSWVISSTHDNFVSTMLRLAAAGKQLSVVDDQRGRPTIADDLVTGTLLAMDAGVTGVLHLANTGETTWFELATRAIAAGGSSVALVAPCRSDEFPRPAARPECSVLNSERLDQFGLEELPPWRDGISEVVERQIQRMGL